MLYKNKKIVPIQQEQVKTGDNKYTINGIDQSKATYLFREDTKNYNALTSGQYVITNEGGNDILEITDSAVNAVIIDFQVIYTLDLESTQDEQLGIVDPNLLRDAYNKAQTDIENLWNYIKNSGIVTDTEDVTLVLPLLNDGEIWVKTGDEYTTFKISDFIDGAIDFISLFDTFSDYTGRANQALVVNVTEDGVTSKVLAISDISGLQTALNGKADIDGLNVIEFIPGRLTTDSILSGGDLEDEAYVQELKNGELTTGGFYRTVDGDYILYLGNALGEMNIQLNGIETVKSIINTAGLIIGTDHDSLQTLQVEGDGAFKVLEKIKTLITTNLDSAVVSFFDNLEIEQARISTNSPSFFLKNFLIGTTSNEGEALQVEGDVRFKKTSSTAFLVEDENNNEIYKIDTINGIVTHLGINQSVVVGTATTSPTALLNFSGKIGGEVIVTGYNQSGGSQSVFKYMFRASSLTLISSDDISGNAPVLTISGSIISIVTGVGSFGFTASFRFL